MNQLIFLTILTALLCLNIEMVRASELLLSGYQRQDGAITLHLNGDRIDPYFASKALLISYATGLDVQRSATAWIEWAIQQQHSDGLFYRICLKNNAYHDCGPADADDAMLAVWVELLTTVAPASGMPSHWQQSMQRAYRYLTTVLYDRQKNILDIDSTESWPFYGQYRGLLSAKEFE